MSGTPSELLRKHQPVLRYDSNECYFADSPAEWTDWRGNRLRRGGEVLATPGGVEEGADLTLGFLGKDYGDGKVAEEDDLIDCVDDDYAADAAQLHEDEEYRNRMYGRAVREPGGGALWLQYWFFYFYNDFNLVNGALTVKAGLHEGDWEMVQLRIGDDGEPDLAVYAQHTEAEVRDWKDVERDKDDEARPLVYPARGSHASYFTPGVHPLGTFGLKWLAHGYDLADGKRETPDLKLLEIEVDGEDWGWTTWPGMWGGTTGGPVPLIDDGSPRGPNMHDQWEDPRTLLPKAEQKAARLAKSPPVTPPGLKSIELDRDPTGLLITYEVEPVDEEHLRGLAVTINSEDDAAPPSTRTVGAADLAATVHLPVPLNPEKTYDITVSAVFDPFMATPSITHDLPRATSAKPPSSTEPAPES